METVIEEFYEKIFMLNDEIPVSEKHDKDKAEFIRHYEELEKTLSEPQKELLSLIKLLSWRLEIEAGKTNFIAGFNYGLRLFAEANK